MSSTKFLWYVVVFQELLGYITSSREHIISISGVEQYGVAFLDPGTAPDVSEYSSSLLTQCSIRCLLDDACESYAYDWVARSCDLSGDVMGSSSMILRSDDITFDTVISDNVVLKYISLFIR